MMFIIFKNNFVIINTTFKLIFWGCFLRHTLETLTFTWILKCMCVFWHTCQPRGKAHTWLPQRPTLLTNPLSWCQWQDAHPTHYTHRAPQSSLSSAGGRRAAGPTHTGVLCPGPSQFVCHRAASSPATAGIQHQTLVHVSIIFIHSTDWRDTFGLDAQRLLSCCATSSTCS